ncbi:endo alpha-1,4 polygalactosaminidase [Sulfuricurvum sp.]|uniref:endo alpha-1,4 polygalactosaminidase n=1 Tax=Sulfuricurvum sp. TaxID=2025608 RepID=UPI003BB7250C
MVNKTIYFSNNFFMYQLSFLFLATSLFAKYPFLIYYGNDYSLKHFSQYETVVLDPDSYPNVSFLSLSHTYAYLSLGEVHSGRSYFDSLRKADLLDGTNHEWGSHHIKIDNGKWKKLLLEEVIPPIIQGGYKGIFLDTVDSLLARNLSKAEIADLIVSIHKKYPKLRLMLNRGFEIADMVPIHALVYESTISGYNYKNNRFSLFDYDFRFIPKRPLERYSVDYWGGNNPKEIEKIYRIALEKGYKPLVTDRSLTKLPVVRWESRKKRIEND